MIDQELIDRLAVEIENEADSPMPMPVWLTLADAEAISAALTAAKEYAPKAKIHHPSCDVLATLLCTCGLDNFLAHFGGAQ